MENNLQKLHDEQDKFIKKTFQEDKVISEPILASFFDNLERSNIKVKRYSYKQRNVIVVLLILLIISVGYNVYFLISPEKEVENTENILNENNSEKVVISNNIENKTDSNLNTNTENAIDEENTTSSNVTIANVTELPKTTKTYSEIDKEELSEFLQDYAIGIQRISYDEETLESNTILLYLALNYFTAKNNSTTSLKVDTTYASSTENIHTYLKELTGKDYSQTEYLSSYNNYVGYNANSKSYVYGKNISEISIEKYSCRDLEITNEKNGIYTATAKIVRTINDEETNYEVTISFKLNDNYKYQKYNIISLKSKNTSFYPDNTSHLVDTTAVE